MRSILFALLLFSSSVLAKQSCESTLTDSSLLAARYMIENCEWKNGVKASEVHLAKICDYRKISYKDVVATSKIEVCNIFSDLPQSLQKGERVYTSQDEFEVTCALSSGEMRPVKISRSIDETELKLMEFSQSELEPFEAGQFRFRLRGGQQEFTISSGMIRGTSFRIDLGTVGGVVAALRKAIQKFQSFRLEVLSIEFVHTHPYESFILTDVKGARRPVLLFLSHVPPDQGDVGLAERIHENLPELPFGITAIIGINKDNLAKMSYWLK